MSTWEIALTTIVVILLIGGIAAAIAFSRNNDSRDNRANDGGNYQGYRPGDIARVQWETGFPDNLIIAPGGNYDDNMSALNFGPNGSMSRRSTRTNGTFPGHALPPHDNRRPYPEGPDDRDNRNDRRPPYNQYDDRDRNDRPNDRVRPRNDQPRPRRQVPNDDAYDHNLVVPDGHGGYRYQQ